MADEEDTNNSFEENEATLRGLVTDTIKKLFTAGVGAAFMTEESVRRYLKDVKLPRDVLNTLLSGANKSKEDLMNVVTNEVVNVIKKIDFVEEASRFVEEHKFRINAEIEVIRKSNGERGGQEINTHVKLDP